MRAATLLAALLPAGAFALPGPAGLEERQLLANAANLAICLPYNILINSLLVDPALIPFCGRYVRLPSVTVTRPGAAPVTVATTVTLPAAAATTISSTTLLTLPAVPPSSVTVTVTSTLTTFSGTTTATCLTSAYTVPARGGRKRTVDTGKRGGDNEELVGRQILGASIGGITGGVAGGLLGGLNPLNQAAPNPAPGPTTAGTVRPPTGSQNPVLINPAPAPIQSPATVRPPGTVQTAGTVANPGPAPAPAPVNGAPAPVNSGPTAATPRPISPAPAPTPINAGATVGPIGGGINIGPAPAPSPAPAPGGVGVTLSAPRPSGLPLSIPDISVSLICSCAPLTSTVTVGGAGAVASTVTTTTTVVGTSRGATATSIRTITYTAPQGNPLTVTSTSTVTIAALATNIVPNGNGLPYKEYDSPFNAYLKDSGWSANYYKSKTPNWSGIWNSLNYATPYWPSMDVAFTLQLDQPAPWDASQVALLWQGFFVAPQSGTFTFTVPSAGNDNFASLWMGPSAYAWTDQTANFKSTRGATTTSTDGVFSITMNAGDAQPFTYLWANGGGAARSSMSILLPDGTQPTDISRLFVQACNNNVFLS